MVVGERCSLQHINRRRRASFETLMRIQRPGACAMMAGDADEQDKTYPRPPALFRGGGGLLSCLLGGSLSSFHAYWEALS